MFGLNVNRGIRSEKQVESMDETYFAVHLSKSPIFKIRRCCRLKTDDFLIDFSCKSGEKSVPALPQVGNLRYLFGGIFFFFFTSTLWTRIVLERAGE